MVGVKSSLIYNFLTVGGCESLVGVVFFLKNPRMVVSNQGFLNKILAVHSLES